MSTIHRAFALATRPPGGHGPWQFVSTAASGGNLMRTDSPFHARTWGSVAEIEGWIAGREAKYAEIAAEKNSKVKVVAREYAVVPVALALAHSSRSLVVCTLEPKERRDRPEDADAHAQFRLS